MWHRIVLCKFPVVAEESYRKPIDNFSKCVLGAAPLFQALCQYLWFHNNFSYLKNIFSPPTAFWRTHTISRGKPWLYKRKNKTEIFSSELWVTATLLYRSTLFFLFFVLNLLSSGSFHLWTAGERGACSKKIRSEFLPFLSGGKGWVKGI